ncbi:MAG: hypothetical protein R3301_03290 [Saprospiraceae bacterium]|nr:hypothetical protein [Saprospiraceae bacterium]
MRNHFLKHFALAGILAAGLILTPGCSRKSGCPAEDAGFQTDKQGNIKVGKTKSGLLPPKATKKRKSR